MNIIAPVFAPGAATSPAIESAVGQLMLEMAATMPGRKVPDRKYGRRRDVSQEVRDRQQRVIEMRSRNMTCTQIAEALGVGRQVVRYDHYRLGLKPHLGASADPEKLMDRRKKVRELRESGMPVREICARFNMSRSAFFRDMSAG